MLNVAEMSQPEERSAVLPIKRTLGLAYLSSLVIVLGMAVASVAGLVLGPELYGAEPPLVQVSPGGDAANLILGLPVLLGSMWLARKGSLVGLLLWPGALFYVLYAYALYLIGAPFGALFFAYVALVTLGAYSVIFLVASIDAESVRQRLTGAPARSVGIALTVIAVLAYVGLTATVVGALLGAAEDAEMRPQWIVDYAVGTPALLLGGVLLWRRAGLGYVVAGGLLLVSGLNGLAFSISAALGGLIPGSATDPAVVLVHLVIGVASIALLVFLGPQRSRRRGPSDPSSATSC